MAGIENTAALSSPVYNPGYDSTDITLYNIMNNDSSDETNTNLRKQYTNVFYNLSTVNPYEGLLQNPLSCDIADANNTANTIITELQNTYGDQTAFDPNNPPKETDSNYQSYVDWNNYVNEQNPSSIVSYITGGVPTTTTYSQDDVLNIPSDAVIGIGADGQYQATTYSQPSNVIPSLSSAKNYTDRSVGNLPMLLSIAQSAMGLAAALSALSNPCLGLSGFFGVLSDIGKEVMAEINKALKYVMSVITEGLEVLLGAVRIAVKYIQKLLNYIKSEIESFIKAMIDMVKMGISSFLKSLKLDACASSLLHTLGTSALLFAM